MIRIPIELKGNSPLVGAFWPYVLSFENELMRGKMYTEDNWGQKEGFFKFHRFLKFLF